jgi:hypothetical protein
MINLGKVSGETKSGQKISVANESAFSPTYPV